MIKSLLQTSVFKTLRFNFHYFGFSGIIKPRIYLAHNVKLEKLTENCLAPKGSKIKVGYFENFAEEGSHKHVLFSNEGILDFTGGGQCISKGCSIFVDKDAKLTLGKKVHIGPNTGLDCHKSLTINDETMVAWNCLIMDRDGHDIIDLNTSNILNPIEAVEIGEHCWICSNSIILKGSIIPNHSVVAAKSTITKKLEKSNCIYVNNNIVRENIDIKF